MPHVELPQAEIKVVILGDSHIGKTSLVTRFAEGYYRDNSRSATLGANFANRSIPSSAGVMTKVQIWDTAGVESFRAMSHSYYKDASAIIVCYDASRRETYDGMRGWLDEVRRRVAPSQNVVIGIAALKIDLVKGSSINHRHSSAAANNTAAIASSTGVPEYEVEQLADALGAIYLPTSAKTGMNVHELFLTVADRVLMYRASNPQQQQQMINVDINNIDGKRKSGVGINNRNNGTTMPRTNGNNISNNNNTIDGISISPINRSPMNRFFARGELPKMDNNNNGSNNNNNSAQLFENISQQQTATANTTMYDNNSRQTHPINHPTYGIVRTNTHSTTSSTRSISAPAVLPPRLLFNDTTTANNNNDMDMIGGNNANTISAENDSNRNDNNTATACGSPSSMTACGTDNMMACGGTESLAGFAACMIQ